MDLFVIGILFRSTQDLPKQQAVGYINSERAMDTAQHKILNILKISWKKIATQLHSA